MTHNPLFLLFAFNMISFANAEIQISELMFNPEDSNEWIEFYNNEGSLDLSDATLTDNFQSDNIGCCSQNCTSVVLPGTYFLILEKDHTFDSAGILTFCVDDSSIGNGLGNNGDTIILNKPNETLVEFSYNTTTAKGHTLAMINSSWKEAYPTPGEENKPLESAEEQDNEMPEIDIIFSTGQIYTSVNYNSLAEIVNTDYPKYSSELNAQVKFNLTFFGENNSVSLLREGIINATFRQSKKLELDLVFISSGNYSLCIWISSLGGFGAHEEGFFAKKCFSIYPEDPSSIFCDVSLSASTQKSVFEEGESIGFDFSLTNTSFEFEIEYWVEDIFGNVVKEHHKTKNLDNKKFTPDFDESDKVFFIKSKLLLILCNNTSSDTDASIMVVAKGKKNAIDNQSKINITGIPPEINFGDILKAEVKLYKGETRKTLIEAYLAGDEKISEITGVKIYGKFQAIDLSIPIIMKDNCENKYPEGDYFLVVSGIDAEARARIKVNKNKDCPGKNEKKTSNSKSSTRSSPAAILPDAKIYEIQSVIQDALSSEVISTLRVYNNDKVAHTYEIWSYLYKGSKSYSGDREGNKLNLTIGQSASEIVTLRSKIIELSEKELWLKIKILREDRKSPYEITANITLDVIDNLPVKMPFEDDLLGTGEPVLPLMNPGEINMSQESDIDEMNLSGEDDNLMTGRMIYESKDKKIKDSAIVFVVFSLAAGIIAFIKIRR